MNDNVNELIKIGKEIFQDTQKKVKSTLDDYLLDNKRLDGNKIINEWFPEVKAHIFLSHSHKDEELAFLLAGFFHEAFNIYTFIDSAVWGYSDDLLRQLDDKYCKNSDGNYNYLKRNYSTTHVHMMLSNSLNRMIDNCECIMFLNTPNSIVTSNEINNKTNSPWIFSEISTSMIVQKRTPIRVQQKIIVFSSKKMSSLNENEQQQLLIDYNVELSHLINLNEEDLENWLETSKNTNAEKALDDLYAQHPLDKRFIIN
ncbi:hypothetical protein [Flavobacterium microcysteis]|uniref:Toll/interleukin-1 receptor domain-containing protein n=1 Tax=Flavobacterium microcysteis TaxID=2596891 RepID=A0A501QDL3_9FLAO|nr:hypothetical protein [Flavobacterium microcysteis]TPD70492.1 hypothetical protein FJA49_06030 [Flavobacterium microcysteis]